MLFVQLSKYESQKIIRVTAETKLILHVGISRMRGLWDSVLNLMLLRKKGYARIYPSEKKIRKVLKQRKEIGEGRTWVKHKIVCVMRDERQRRSHANVIAKVVSLLHPVSDGDFFSMALSHSCRHNWLVRRSFH